ncbi:Alkanesulfonate monooxygenase [Andreprevotia sp. IGB-42]|uniref:LLM class flavin-dependent oxidoreductase n=1 Tax=Andreprevotia sp. IGB-42 TaxID=2497473 RepID=UPI0013576527|nr:LLM class flavin-dependent oxidoreductase [Andreprevotia sp. IGB-42]KAF0812642.1 Alkanesulfonate monooxygenase [Andreprevotia sp. IGB-42]
MTVEFIGLVSTQDASESLLPYGKPIDRQYVAASATAHENAGFDRVLIGYFSQAPDGFQVASQVAFQTETLSPLLAHRPGFVAPTVAARAFASLDQLSDGRLSINVISGGDDVEQARDGDFLSHDERYERTDEYLDVLKKTWDSTAPFDHDGKYYQVRGLHSPVKPVNGRIPIYFSGSSEAAIRVAAKHADVYMLWGEPVENVREVVRKVRAAAAEFGRDKHIRFSLSLRPVLAHSEEAAWAKADRILASARDNLEKSPFFRARPAVPQNVGSQRLLQIAGSGRVADERLWTEIAALTGARGNSTGLVGTPQQVAESLLAYYDVGVSTFLIRGFEPLADTVQYGRHLIPLVRRLIAERSDQRIAA